MFRKIIFPVLISIFTHSVTTAQQAWSLEDCIAYAMENNIMIKQSVLNTEYNENVLKQSRLSQIPNLKADARYT
jgi:outer membrane protein